MSSESSEATGAAADDRSSSPLDHAVYFECGLSPAELHSRLIERLSPPSILVNSLYEIVHRTETAARLLRYTGEEPPHDLLRAIHPMLRVELNAALSAAARTNAMVMACGIPMDSGETRNLVNIRVAPAGEPAPGFLLIIFEEYSVDTDAAIVPPAAEATDTPLHLERELATTNAHLRGTIEEF
ncbi:MAG: hypothetical protein KDB01_07580 [Planctomycetaceae bacterium]|nr:hypothetical protein [Planctomycetaceae bacterium]